MTLKELRKFKRQFEAVGWDLNVSPKQFYGLTLLVFARLYGRGRI